jgi:hypothetical protein
LRVERDALTGTPVTLNQLILFAYHLNASQLSGPSWIETEPFDITAKANGASRAELGLSLQAKGGPYFRDREKEKTQRRVNWFHLEWAPYPGPDALLQALRDQLGLDLEAPSARQDILVIDHAERP